MDSELIIFAAVILIVAVVAVWRDPRSAGQVIKDIFTQFSKREKPNDINRDDEDDPRD